MFADDWGEQPTCVLLQTGMAFLPPLSVILLFLPLSPQFGEVSEAVS